VIVVADTSPLNYLILIEHDHLLSKLYQRVFVPQEVMNELSDPAAPPVVQSWVQSIPDWLEVKAPHSAPDEALQVLDPGERQAIQLAQEQGADLLLIDERRGSVAARRLGLTTTGTIGVRLAAGELGLIKSEDVCRRLFTETTFRVTPELRAKFFR
jgi:predicted nucleic acid-binding protein